MTDYERGYKDAAKLARKIFFEFVDERVNKGVFFCDLDHVRAYKRYFSERIARNGSFAQRHPERKVK